MSKVLKNELNGDYKIEGVAKLTTNQIASLERNRANLTQGHIYLIPAQVFHNHPDQRSRTGYSNRCAVIEFDGNGNKVGTITMSLSALRAMYYGAVIEGVQAPLIKCERNVSGLMRPTASAPRSQSNISGMLPRLTVTVRDGVKTAAIESPFAFKVTGRKRFYAAKFNDPVKDADGNDQYDMTTDENDHLELDIRTDYTYESQAADDFTNKCEASDVAKIKDYLL